MPQRKRAYAAAFFLPVGLYLIVLLAARVVPFGENTLLLWDANSFYISFLSYWRGALAGGQDLLYTVNRALGSNMAGLTAYFLASPVNALLLLFPENAMPLFYSVLALAKIGLCGLTMYVFLRKRYACGQMALLFSSSYALCGFMAVYVMHVMWLDALILLPLVALGVYKIVNGERPFAYIVALGLTIFSQYYMGYMVCLFSGLYFVYLSLEGGIGIKAFFKRLIVFAFASLLAAGLAAVLLIPAVYTVLQGYSLFDTDMLSAEGINTALGVLAKLYTASVGVIQLRSGGPNIYIGIPLLVFALLYFVSRAIPLKKRLLSLGFAAVFLVSFLFAAPYYIWHAFNSPNFFPARFSFLFSFFLIELAWQGYRGMKRGTDRRAKINAAIVTAGFLVLTAVLLSQMMYIEYLALKTVILDAALFVGTCLLALWLRKARLRKAAVALLCVMQAGCLLLNGYYAIARLNDIWTPTVGEFTQETDRGRELVGRVKTEDGGLYRMEFDYHRTDTDPFTYDYYGLTHFSPDADAAMIAFAEKIGLLHIYYHIRYSAGAGPVLESLLGVKYVLRKDGVAFEPLPEGYEELWRDGDVTAYQNDYALPLAYLAPEQTLTLDGGSIFENQNILLCDLTGEDRAVFTSEWDIGRTFDGTWETYTFPVRANAPLYMKSEGEAYVFNGAEESTARMNGTVLLPAADDDTAYTVSMTAPLGIALAYFNLEAFQAARAVLAAHAAELSSDTDSHFVIAANVTDAFTQLVITLPYDKGWRAWVDGERVETVSRYDALLAVNLAEGAHTVELRYTPPGLWAGAAVSLASLLLVLFWVLWPRIRQGRRRSREGE